MNKKTLSVFILISGVFISGAIISFANAQTTASVTQRQQTPENIQYPIKELGNCQSKKDCKIFCDDPKNSDTCLVFAKQHNLMSSDEVTAAKKFMENGMVGPGGCKGQAACDQYCGNSTHIEECTTFAKDNGMLSDQQLQDSQKVLAAIKNGLKPPACAGSQQCNAYCSSPEHMAECMTFSLAAGIVPDNQKEQVQKTLDAIKQGIKPPACQPNQPGQSDQTQSNQSDQSNQPVQGLPTCDQYCGTHMEECMTFSLAAGTVPDNQKEQVQKTLDAIKQGIKPPACQGPQECDQYCADPIHVEECVKFSVAMGSMTEQQAQIAIKTGNKGPGGCIGKDACDVFCNNPDNQETCFNFGKENGMIPQADLQKMQDGQQRMKDSFSQIPQEVLDCITSSVGADVVEKMKTGSVIQRKAGDSINQCFQKFGVQEKMPNQNQNGQGQQNQQGKSGQPGQNQGQPRQPNQPGQEQPNQQNQPWADMCKPDGNGNPTALACVDDAGKFVASAKVGSDGKPVCPAGSTAKCGNYQQNNQQGQQQNNQMMGPNQGQGFNPGSGQNGNGPGNGQGNQQGQGQPGQQIPQQAGPGGCKGPEECNVFCQSNPEVCKNFKPQQNQGQPGQPNQPGQVQPQQPQIQSQPPTQQQNPPSMPSSFLQKAQKFLANILDAFR